MKMVQMILGQSISRKGNSEVHSMNTNVYCLTTDDNPSFSQKKQTNKQTSKLD